MINRFLRVVIATGLALLTLSSAAHTQGAGGSLEGTIKGPNGKPFPNCTVIVSALDGNRVIKSATDKHGKYQVKQLASGWYRVTIRPPEFGDQLYLNYERSVVISASRKTTLSTVLKWKQDPREDCEPAQTCF
jgi:hypothetical protein